MGTDAAGEKIKDHVKQLAPLLQDKNISPNDKMRLILLYIIQKGGDTQSARLKLLAHMWHTDYFLTTTSIMRLCFSALCQAFVTAPQCSSSTPRGQKPNCSL